MPDFYWYCLLFYIAKVHFTKLKLLLMDNYVISSLILKIMSDVVPLKCVNYVIYSQNYVRNPRLERHNFVSSKRKLIQMNIISGKEYKSNRIKVMVDLLIIKIN